MSRIAERAAARPCRAGAPAQSPVAGALAVPRSGAALDPITGKFGNATHCARCACELHACSERAGGVCVAARTLASIMPRASLIAFELDLLWGPPPGVDRCPTPVYLVNPVEPVAYGVLSTISSELACGIL